MQLVTEFLNYAFTDLENEGQSKPQCVFCLKVLTPESMKKSQLKTHFDNLHAHLSFKPRKYFENLEKGVKKQRINNFGITSLRFFINICSLICGMFCLNLFIS